MTSTLLHVVGELDDLDIDSASNPYKAWGGVRIAAEKARSPVPALPLDEGMAEHVRRGAEAHAPGAWQNLHSGAVHDAGVMARVMPSVMLFVPSINGISHDFAEDTSEEDIAIGVQAYVSAAASMLDAEMGS